MQRQKKMVLRIAYFAGLAAIASVLAGCADKLVMISQGDLCKSWRHQTVSKQDKLTQGTAKIAEGNNNARPLWGCEPGKDRAQGKG